MDGTICQRCQAAYPLDEPRWRCDCGGLLDIRFTARLELELIRNRPPDLWRYREAFPLAAHSEPVSLGEGFTPLIRVTVSGHPIWIKQDHLFPTGSYKDRGAAVLISKAKELGVKRVVEDSSGNAGCAIAAYCARAGIACDIYVPADTSADKLTQIASYGARLHRVRGDREATARAAWEAAQTTYYASHSWNPFFFQGTKTFAYEVCEQLGWRAPDTVVLPAGNGTLLLGAYLGFDELRAAGIIERIPKMVAVQAAACAPLWAMFARGLAQVPTIQKGHTLAEGIAIAEPVRGAQIVAAVRHSGGQVVAVREEQIVAALRATGRQGFYIEPTSAATIAGLALYLEEAPQGELIVSVFTGHGLKATDKLKRL
ncbi:MAG: threonine synthase [Anaerolineae bacterium]|nr:threonine synthase [Anaerolineae bacterium]